MKLPRAVWITLAALLAAAFAWLNRFERTTLRLGFVSLPDLPLAVICLACVLLGMAAMLLLTLPQDRRTRDLLRAHGLLGQAPPAPAGAPAADDAITAAPPA